MKLSKYRPSKDNRLELSTTSMIDVVFLLLIFFLVTTTFLRPERQIKPNIKALQESSATTSTDLEPAIIDIYLQDDVPVYRIGSVVSEDINRIDSVLNRLDQRSKTSGAFVRLSDDAPYGMAAIAINACKSNGIVLVTLVPL